MRSISSKARNCRSVLQNLSLLPHRKTIVRANSSSRNKNKNNNSKNNSSKLSQSSRKWLNRQQKDKYTKKAKADGSPSRSIFKLEEIAKHINNNRHNNKIPKEIRKQFKFLQPGDTVIDLGVSFVCAFF